MGTYEVTVSMPNGDWHWTRFSETDFHDAAVGALKFAEFLGGRLIRIEKVA